MTTKPSYAIACAALVLAACSADGVRLQSYYNYPAYDYRNFTLYHAGRETDVDVYGNPFGMERQAFEKAVTDAMQGANFGRPTRFSIDPGPSAERNLRVVMAFNTDGSPYDLCDATNYAAGTRGNGSGNLHLRAAWCFDGRQDSWVDATVSGIAGIDDPRFRALIRQAVLNLFVPDTFRERHRGFRDRRHRGRLHLHL